MISRRLVVNLIVFFLVSFALVAYGVVNLLGNPLQSPTTLTTQFPNASGLYPGFEVELNGVPVGTVSSTSLTASATKVTMSIDPGVEVPRDVQSSVQIANDLGEQVVNLVPAHGGSVPDLQSGATVPAAPNQVPADVGAVVASATRLLRAIPADDLNTLIGELATSLAGRAGDLRTLISAGTTFSRSSSPTSSNSPSCWPTRRRRSMRSPPSRPSCARTWPTPPRSSRCWRSRRAGCTRCSPRARPPSAR